MLLISYGTRPEWLKVKPVIEELKKRNLPFKTFFTGQHKNLVMPEADFKMIIQDSASQNRLNHVLSLCITNGSFYFEDNKDISYVMVQGDTTSALGMALAAYNCKVKVIHLEAGLRTYDMENPFPEEANRQLIARISDIHFCPTTRSYLNLRNERIESANMHVVGNTALDNLVDYLPKCTYNNKVLVTLHRRENHDKIKTWFTKINKLAQQFCELEFIFPIHPNPNVQKHRNILTDVKVVDPLPHDELLNILVECKAVITDSGGLQEEGSFLKKKVIVCRDETERPEALGITSFLSTPEILHSRFVHHIIEDGPEVNEECPFGDGYAAKKIVDVLEETVYDKVD